MTEQEKKDHFMRVLRKRRSSIIEQIQKLANLKNNSYYAYSDEEMIQSLRLIRTTLKTTEKIINEK